MSDLLGSIGVSPQPEDRLAVAALVATGIERRFATADGELCVLRNATLTVEAGSVAAIMGPSGSGKSTLLNILGTLDTPSAGTVLIRGVDPFSLDEVTLARFRNRAIGLVFQDHLLLPQCTAIENVLVPTMASNSPTRAEERATELLKRVGLEERMNHFPSQLSGGERQRVAIARALIHKPALVLADEPTGNLDRVTAERIAELLIETASGQGAALVVVTHSEALAKRADRRYSIEEGVLQPHLRVV